jgi:DGQHR domain-containing protein
MAGGSIQKISVIVPKNPFVKPQLSETRHCLAALDVEKLMKWWPGTPHTPNRDPKKVRDIQRSLDWKRVAQIAAYLLQDEIIDAPDRLDEAFREIYEPKKLEPGREWPPKVPKVVRYEKSEYPTFSNVLLHVNGAKVEVLEQGAGALPEEKPAMLVFDEQDRNLHFSVIDGQHRINGAFFALWLLRRRKVDVKWEIPAEIFLDLDRVDQPPRRQAQIFIDVNFNQKKVDRSLVADLFPTARGPRSPLDDKERAQDIGRRLMLEEGPLVGMIQIPGVRFGVKDVVTLATLNSAVERVLTTLSEAGLSSLDEQTGFFAQCLSAWLEASGRKHDLAISDRLDPENVAYQGRILVSAIDLIPVCIWKIRKERKHLISTKAEECLTNYFRDLLNRAGLLRENKFLPKGEFKKKGFLGSGGIGRFRDTLWAAAIGDASIARLQPERRAEMAESNRSTVSAWLARS